MEKKTHFREEHSNRRNCVTITSVPDWDEPFTEEDLEAIEAAFLSASNSLTKRPRPSSPHSHENDNNNNHNSARRDSSVDYRGGRRRLPISILAPQNPNPFTLSPCQGTNLRMRYPVMKFGGVITYSRTAFEVEAAAMELLKTFQAKKTEVGQAALGFDIEWRPTFKRGVSPGRAAVVQICGDTSHCHVMHIIHSGITQSLKLLLENCSLLKVGVGIGNDAVKVFKDYNVSVRALEDLSYLANQKLGGGSQRWSLGSLTEKLTSKKLLKPNKIKLGNWEANVLSKEQLEYAATDAFTSWYLYEVLRGLPDVEKMATNDKSEEPKDAAV
ncbi:hypothetical protein FNV43_RR01292 [Rhamnella rubrinervis]|uniref:3'-5' exonuclease n=1 Tax=Rhamnella rubrinervis TaxID=2594499 RepID=A0A8K0MSU1_9ROSA|nr:hypothetical protein FNV43_RR01292 [Rhamnella rubrinervis]